MNWKTIGLTIAILIANPIEINAQETLPNYCRGFNYKEYCIDDDAIELLSQYHEFTSTPKICSQGFSPLTAMQTIQIKNPYLTIPKIPKDLMEELVNLSKPKNLKTSNLEKRITREGVLKLINE